MRKRPNFRKSKIDFSDYFANLFFPGKCTIKIDTKIFNRCLDLKVTSFKFNDTISTEFTILAVCEKNGLTFFGIRGELIEGEPRINSNKLVFHILSQSIEIIV